MIGYALSSEERTPQELAIAAAAENAAELAGRIGDALISTAPREQVVYLHQVGSDQDAFLRLYEREVLSVAVR